MPVKQNDRPAETKSSVEALIEAFCKTGMKQVEEDLTCQEARLTMQTFVTRPSNFM